jgi:hypothetical protein
MNNTELKKNIREILVASVYGEGFEDTELNVAVEELANLLTASHDEIKREAVRSYEKEIFEFQTDVTEDIGGIQSMVIKIPVITWKSIRKKYLTQQSLDKGDRE